MPPVAGRLIDVLIQRGNASGAVRPAPHALRELKSSIVGVPFQLLSPSMSGVLTAGNLGPVVQRLAQMPGMSLASLGKLQSVLGQLSQLTVGSGGDPSWLVDAIGAGAAIGTALMAYGGALDTVARGPGGTPPGGPSSPS